MAQVLADHEIKKLLDSIIVDSDENRIKPNSIELRLGAHVKFSSTGEENELKPGTFLQVNPGETVLISSLEKIDFTPDTVNKIYPNSMLMGLITPTTTMMREGISQLTTKIDAGFRGKLNWSLRNNSNKELVVQYGEPIFKLTIFLLEGNEVPNLPYGERETDKYQDSDGIVRSTRQIPADIPKNKIISSSFAKLDPKKQLREAGYPFDHIGTELVALDGKFEMVSKDVLLMKEQFEKRTGELSTKIDNETEHLSGKLKELQQSFLDSIETIFTKKFTKIAGVVVGLIPLMYGANSFLKIKNLSDSARANFAVAIGIVIIATAFILTHKKK